MIIVSQNKEKVKKYNNIITISYDNNYETKEEFWIVFVDGEDMGHYKTREKAKEILQELINFYEISKRNECSSNNGLALFVNETFVYKMPEE